MWVPIVLFVSVAIVFCAFFYFHFRFRREVQTTLRTALEQGRELTPELVESIAGEAGGSRDLRRGVIGIALAVALAIFAMVTNEREIYGIAAFPLMLGIAYLALWRFYPTRRA